MPERPRFLEWTWYGEMCFTRLALCSVVQARRNILVRALGRATQLGGLRAGRVRDMCKH
jgi:hypothetical protein